MKYPLSKEDFVHEVVDPIQGGDLNILTLSGLELVNFKKRETGAISTLVEILSPRLLAILRDDLVVLADLASGASGKDHSHFAMTEKVRDKIKERLLVGDARSEFILATSERTNDPNTMIFMANMLPWAVASLMGYYEWATEVQ